MGVKKTADFKQLVPAPSQRCTDP